MISQSESGVAGGPIGAESVTLNRSTTTTCRSSTNMGVGEQQNFWRVKLVKHCFAVGDLSESHWEVYNQEMLVWKEGQDLVTWTHQKTSENLIVFGENLYPAEDTDWKSWWRGQTQQDPRLGSDAGPQLMWAHQPIWLVQTTQVRGWCFHVVIIVIGNIISCWYHPHPRNTLSIYRPNIFSNGPIWTLYWLVP